jgi:hypothetical protein
MNKIAILVSVVATGCMLLPDAKPPKGGAVATGAPLAVVDDVKVWTTQEKEKVGETVYTDASGNTIGKGETYKDTTKVHTMKVWYPVQGTEQLSDEDFFRIAGDQAALDATKQARDKAIDWNKKGKYTLAGGVAAMIAGYLIPNPTVQYVLLVGGGLAVSGGWYLAYWGAKQMEPEAHAVDRSVADRAAQQYNQGIGRSAGLSLSRSF